MTDLELLTDERISAFKVQSFAESFLDSPLARAVFERGQPLRFFLPVMGEDNFEWKGVEITIAGVPRRARAPATQPRTLSLRGNGHCDNPKGPLQPSDYGVHSHPDTGKLLKPDAPARRTIRRRRRDLRS